MRASGLARPLGFARLARVATLCLAFVLSAATSGAQQNAEQPLTNAAVIKLVRAGFKEKTIIAVIQTRPSRFDLSPDHLIELKKHGVNENIILAMIAHQDAGDALAFDPDMSGFDDIGAADSKMGRNPGGSDIFGSSAGSNSRTRGRGQSGSSQEDTLTTGSATVHILRPPLEEGGAPKLEKTPTLTNESIVAMVDAGFSEGTIVRRIEQSPGDFDLSLPKLADLRKHRVTEPLINAMRAAMGEDAPSSGAPKNPEK